MASNSSAGKGKTVSTGTKNDDERIGTEDHDKILGGNGNDLLIGGAGADEIYGGAGNDTILGGGGNDKLKGDSGDDILDGGAGSDEVEGGSGNDVAIYVMSENIGSHDDYDGGSGVDTLRLVFTRAQWMQSDVQSDIARYLAFIAANTNASGQANGHEFHFTAFGLEATKFEKLEVMVDGRMLDPRDELADAIDDTAAVTEDGSVSGNVLANDNVPDLVRSVDLVTGPAQGQLTFNADGSYTYVPGAYFNALAQGETATQSFTYRVTDADGDTDTATVTITITGTNDGPVAAADTAAGTENQALVIDVLANDTDVDHGAVLHVAAASVAAGQGTVTINPNNTLAFDPGSDFDHLAQGATATVVVNYTVSDEHGATDEKAVIITITGANDAPVAVNDSNALTVTSLASVTHTNTVHWVDWTSATAGKVTGTIDLGNGNTIGVTYSGEYAFAQTNGGTNYYTTPAARPGDTSLGTGTYTSTAVGNGPTGSDIIALSQATQKTLTFSQPVDNLFFAVVSLNGNGYLLDQDFQVLSYGRGYWGDGYATKLALPDGRYEVVGNGELHGVLGINGTVQSLTWTSATPEYWNGFTVGTYGKSQTATASGNVLANDTDPDAGDTVFVSAVNGHAIAGNYLTLDLASGARVTVNKDGTYLYDEHSAFGSLGQGQTAVDSFTYTVTDNHGASSTASVNITVTGINDGPTAVNDTVTAIEDTPLTISAASLLANDTDPDIGDMLGVVSVQNATHGTVSFAGGNVIFTPDANYNGAASFGYTMKDAAGATSSATVNVTVNPVSDTYTLSNLVTNGSFEQGTSGWTQINGGVDVVYRLGWQPGDGSYSVDLNAFHPGGVQQVLQTTPGVQYTIGFELSKNPGNTDHATVLVSAGGSSQSYTFSDANTGADMKWSQQTFSFTATGTSTTLSFASTYPTDATGGFPVNAQGPALDEVVMVSNKAISNFTTGAGGDVLQLHDVLTSVSAPHDSTAFSGGFVRFLQSGSDTVVQVDANGGGDSYLTLATLANTLLTQSDTANYVL